MKKILITAILLFASLSLFASDSTYTTYSTENTSGYEGNYTADSGSHEWFTTQTVTTDTIGVDSLLWVKTITTSRQCTKCGRQEVHKDIWNTYLKKEDE